MLSVLCIPSLAFSHLLSSKREKAFRESPRTAYWTTDMSSVLFPASTYNSHPSWESQPPSVSTTTDSSRTSTATYRTFSSSLNPIRNDPWKSRASLGATPASGNSIGYSLIPCGQSLRSPSTTISSTGTAIATAPLWAWEGIGSSRVRRRTRPRRLALVPSLQCAIGPTSRKLTRYRQHLP